MSPIYVKCLIGSAIPFRVRDLTEPPERLYLVGELPRGPSVAVVGTRTPTNEALTFTAELVKSLVNAGCSIWSGGAEGIDHAAHVAALKAKGKTVVVSPSGWDRPYPEKHAALYQRIVDSGGGFLSIEPPESPALQCRFFERNALLVAVTHGVVVVQAGIRSGARNAAKHARRLNRPLFVVPSCPWVHQGLGCNLELNYGGVPVSSAKEVVKRLSELGLYGAISVDSEADAKPENLNVRVRQRRESSSRGVALKPTTDGLDTELKQLFTELTQGAKTVDDLCQRTGRSAAVVQSDLLRLTLQGYVRLGRSGGIEIVNI